MPKKLSAATSEDEAMRQLDDWLLVLKHLDNLEAVHACSPLCAAYNSGLSRALLTAANAGKHNAIPLLAGVFRCSVPLVSLQVALDPTSHLHCSHDCVHHISRLLLDMLLSVHGNVHGHCCLTHTASHVFVCFVVLHHLVTLQWYRRSCYICSCTTLLSTPGKLSIYGPLLASAGLSNGGNWTYGGSCSQPRHSCWSKASTRATCP